MFPGELGASQGLERHPWDSSTQILQNLLGISLPAVLWMMEKHRLGPGLQDGISDGSHLQRRSRDPLGRAALGQKLLALEGLQIPNPSPKLLPLLKPKEICPTFTTPLAVGNSGLETPSSCLTKPRSGMDLG